MITRRLLRNERHRAMITPVISLLAKLIRISQSYWAIYCWFEIILKIGTVHWTSNSMLYINPLLQKNTQGDVNYFKKYLIASGSSGSNG